MFITSKNIVRMSVFALALALFSIGTTPTFAMGSWQVSSGSTGLCTTADRHCATIQAAVDAAGDNSTIHVADGTYAENVILTGKNRVNIVGEGASTIVEPASGMGFAIMNSANISIKKLHIHTTGLAAHGVWVAGTPSGGAAMDSLVLQDNTFVVDGYSAAVYSEQSTVPHSRWLIGGKYHGNNITVNPGATETGDGMDLHDLSNSEVSYNEIMLNTPTNSTAVLWTSELANLTNLKFKNNTVSGSSGSMVGFLNNFIGDGSSSIRGLTITDNTFDAWGSRALRLGTRTSAVEVKENSFLDTGQALWNQGTAITNAQYNWWGEAKPTWSEKVSGYVTYDPWYTDANMKYLSSEKKVLTFTLTGGISRINNGGGIIVVSVPKGTNLTSMTPVITVSPGATISPLSGVARDFSAPVTYIVTAADDTTKTFTVRVLATLPAVY